MSRVINTNNPAKQRNFNRRTIAEMLKHIIERNTIDETVKDMAATIVFALVEIEAGVKVTASAWEKRDYWMKAERFMREWAWAQESAANLDDVLRHEAWDLLPALLMQLMPRFSDIKINKFMRKAIFWEGNYARLLQEDALELPY